MIAMTPSSCYRQPPHMQPMMSPPPSVRTGSALTPTSSNDEIDAVAALISLPSVGAPSASDPHPQQPQAPSGARHHYSRKLEHRSLSTMDYPRHEHYYQPPHPPHAHRTPHHGWNQHEATAYAMDHRVYGYRTYPSNQEMEPPFYMRSDGHDERLPTYRGSTTNYAARPYPPPQQQYFPTTPLVSSTPRPPPAMQQNRSRATPTTLTGSPIKPSHFFGSTSLYLSDDEDVLSPLHCFMRKHCVEAFAATADDGATSNAPAGRGKVVAGQVGIQCVHCKHLEQRPERAVCFPSSLRNIYHSMETWQRRHAVVCKYIPGWIRQELERLTEQSKSSAGGRRQYWEDAALKVGMVNCPSEGIVRFVRRPGPLHSPQSSTQQNGLAHMDQRPLCLVTGDDEPLVTPYLYLLMSQMQACYFTEADRSGGRSKVKDLAVGYPGMQCRHCNGKSGLGRYFPLSSQALALANSDRNMYNHLIKCRKCPKHVQNDLQRLRKRGSSGASNETKNKRGSRKLFFERVWGRIHRQGSNALPTLETADNPPRFTQENEMDIGNTCSI